MTRAAKVAANKRNALRSTGPKTPAGKAITRLNAYSHGFRAASPVVPGEDPAEWDRFRGEVVADLAPVGSVEEALAERVALLLWRLRRVSAFETAVVTQQSDEAARRVRGEDESDHLFLLYPAATPPTPVRLRRQAEELERFLSAGERLTVLLAQLAGTPAAPWSGADAVFLVEQVCRYLPADEDDLDDDEPPVDPMERRFLAAVGVPAETHERPAVWGGWTVGAVRRWVELVARSVGCAAGSLLAHATAACAADLERHQTELLVLGRELKAAERRAKVEEAAARRRALVAADAVDVVVKYEGHFQRQLAQVLHELERRQALRSDRPPHPPVVVDVTIHEAEEGGTTPLPLGD